MTDMIQFFRELFGEYQPIQNVSSFQEDLANMVETTTYSYSIDFSAIAHYILVIILFWCVCKCVSVFICNLSKGVSLR